jgi:serine protease Do
MKKNLHFNSQAMIKTVILSVVLIGLAVFVPSVVQAKVLPFNEKKVPETQDDLLSIQQALVDHLPQARAATVSIKLAEGFGSGVIVSADGVILTAAHVAGGVNKELTVIMNDGTEYKAVSMGVISTTDAAMIRIVDEGSFPYVEINRDNDYKLGHWVFALGHSGGFDESRGPVVRLGRIVQDKETTLQTDCKVIGGDSGGPLFDLFGRLIAIHSRVGMETVAENYHVPMREYLAHWDELEKAEFVGNGPSAKRPEKGSGFLGVGTEDTEKGVRITKLAKEGVAEKAGLKVGDLILKMNDEKISDKVELKAKLAEMAESDTLTILISRDGKSQTISLRLGKR